MIDVLLIAVNDWANTGWRTMKCLESLDLRVLGLKGFPHSFIYPHQLTLHPALANPKDLAFQMEDAEIKHLMEEAKVVHFIASSFVWPIGVDLTKKKIVFQHGGISYRRDHKAINEIYNQYASATIVQMPDLMGLGAKNEHLIYFSVDTDYLQPVFADADPDGRLVIGHFPSTQAKGTRRIEHVILQLQNDPATKGKFVYRSAEPGKAMWFDALDHMGECDLIIDVFADTVMGGLAYGEWGNTSFEASALGKIVCTMSLKKEVYAWEYGTRPELHITNTEEELREALKSYILMPKQRLSRQKQQVWEWVDEHHSIRATAQRLWDKVYKNLS